jgi:hypothetical protein
MATWIIRNLAFFLVVLFIGIILFVYRAFSEAKSEIKEQERKQLELEKIKKTLISNGDYRYIKNFVKKYKEIYSENYEDCEEVSKLEDLLIKKGYSFYDEEIIHILNGETEIQNYEDFKEKILHNEPKKLEDYINNFIEIFGDNYCKYILFLENLLKERNFQYDHEQILEKIEETKKEIELSHFEKKT